MDMTFTNPFVIDDEQIKRLAAEPQAKEGTYEWLVVDEQVFVSEKGKAPGTIFYKVRVSPLKVAGDPTSADKRIRVEHLTAMPLANPDVEGHKAPQYAGSTSNELLSAMGIVDRAARFTRGADEQAAKEKALGDTVRSSLALVQKELSLKGRTFFASLVRNGEYTNLRGLSADLGDRVLMSPPFIE